jgi:hypothetical protein
MGLADWLCFRSLMVPTMFDLNDFVIIAAFGLVLGLLRRRRNAHSELEHDVARENLALKKMSIRMRGDV